MLFKVISKEYPHTVYTVYKIEYSESDNETRFFMYDNLLNRWFWDKCSNYETHEPFNV